jgi:hypothetical protein
MSLLVIDDWLVSFVSFSSAPFFTVYALLYVMGICIFDFLSCSFMLEVDYVARLGDTL